MSDEVTLRDIDIDGAVQATAAEAMEAVQGDTRSQFLRRAGLAGAPSWAEEPSLARWPRAPWL